MILIGPARLQYGHETWDPRRHSFSDLVELAPRGFEREELDRMKELVEAGRIWRRETPGGVFLQVEKPTGVVKAFDPATRIATVVASTKRRDFYGDTIDPHGWLTDTYNGVVLIDHDYRIASIVGRSPRQWVDGKKVKACDENCSHNFMMEHVFNPAGDAAADMLVPKITSRSARANSVGFKPVTWSRLYEEDQFVGFAFETQHLLEDSWVAVGANPDALVQGAVEGPEVSPDAQESAQAAALDERLRKTNERLIAARIADRLGG